MKHTIQTEKKFYIQIKNKHNFFILLRQNLNIRKAIHYAKNMAKQIDFPILIVDSETEKVFLTINSISNEKAMGRLQENHV